MARSKEYVDASHALIDLSHALSLLESENASLRGAADGLCNDNAKLRELVRDMRRFIGAACKKYPRLFDPSAQGGQMVYPNMLDSFEQRMRNLGVEVDA